MRGVSQYTSKDWWMEGTYHITFLVDLLFFCSSLSSSGCWPEEEFSMTGNQLLMMEVQLLMIETGVLPLLLSDMVL
jgi:hypothetical protein